MPAYAVIDINVKDPVRYEEYKKKGALTLEQYGGKPLIRGGAVEVIEGKWSPQRMVIIEFKDMEALKRWWFSPEYCEAKKLRHGAAEANVVFVEGLK